MGFEEYGHQVHDWLSQLYTSRGVHPDETIRVCNQILEYARKLDDEKLLGLAYYYLGETYYLLNNVDRLFLNVSSSLVYLENTGQYELIARAYNILAITSYNRGNAPFAMDYYLGALSYCDRYHLEEVSVMIRINIGMLYNGSGEYQKAQHYFEEAYQKLKERKNLPEYDVYLMSIYIGMGNSYLQREQTQKAQEYENRARTECYDRLGETGKTCFLCFQARLYNSVGKNAQRDTCIEEIQKRVHEKMVVLDIFDDFYSYCEMLFEIGRYEEMQEVLEWLGELAESTHIIHMQKRLLRIYIRYYRLRGDEQAYLQACARFYELTELSDKENRYMVSSVLTMRDNLEETNRRKKEMERENRQLMHTSKHDALTGLSNRVVLNEYAEEAFRRCVKKQCNLAVELLDIDYFKQYNDNYGHQAGDACIQGIAQVLKRLQEHDHVFAARYGGDEFVVIYEGYTESETYALAEELKQGILDLNMEHRYSLAAEVVTISQGICCDIPQAEQKVWDYLHAADVMLYKGKKLSRNSVQIEAYNKL